MKLKELFDYEVPRKETKEGGGAQKKAWKFLAGFLVFMLLLSMVSRTADSMSVAKVKTQKPRAAALEHKYTVDGQISTNKLSAESIVGGIRVASVEVVKGDEVKKGDLLFTLDKTSLEEEYLKAEQEFRSLRHTSEDKETNREQALELKQRQITRAEQDYEIQLRKTNKAVARAWKRVEEAQRKLNGFNWSKYNVKPPVTAPPAAAAPEEGFTDRPENPGDSADPVENQLMRALNGAEFQLDLSEQELGYRKDLLYEVVRKFEEAFDYDDPSKTTVAGYEPEQREYNRQIHDMAFQANGGFDPEGRDCFDPVIRRQMDSLRSSVLESFYRYDRDYLNAKEAYEKSLTARDQAQTALDTYLEEKKAQEEAAAAAGGQEAAEAAAAQREAGRAAYEGLVQSYNSAYEAYSDAVADARDMETTGKRSIEDAKEPESADSASEYDLKTSLKLKKIAFSRIRELKKAGGEIRAGVDGIVTDVKVTTGETSPEGTCVMLGDTDSGYTFTGTVTKEEAKYMQPGMMVTLDCVYHGEETKLQASVDEVTASLDNPEQYFVSASVMEDGSDGVGTSATMNIDSRTEKFDLVVPGSAVHYGKDKPYVLAVRETKGVLGTTLEVEKIEITVKDKDDSSAAVTGSLTAVDQVVVETNRNLKTGDRVRLSEQ